MFQVPSSEIRVFPTMFCAVFVVPERAVGRFSDACPHSRSRASVSSPNTRTECGWALSTEYWVLSDGLLC